MCFRCLGAIVTVDDEGSHRRATPEEAASASMRRKVATATFLRRFTAWPVVLWAGRDDKPPDEPDAGS